MRRLVSDLLAVAVVGATGLLVLSGYATYRIWQVGSEDQAARAGAIVVLGAAQFDGQPSDVFAARLDHAVDLYLEGYAPYLVVTGGKADGDRFTEADTARRYAMSRGVKASAILSEDSGRTTFESLAAVRSILEAHGIQQAIFVSDRTHMLRVLRMAGDLGIDGLGSPTPTSPSDLDSGRRIDATIHELGALALYFTTEQPLPSGN